MKSLIFSLLILFTTQAFAENCTESTSAAKVDEQMEIKTDVPKHLKGAMIIVRLADGRESQVPAEKFKVVPRKQQYLVTKTSTETVRSCTNLDHNRNRVSLMGGEGPTGHLDRDSSSAPGKVSVESERGAVGGAQYQRLLNDRWSLGIQGQTNKTGMVMIGLDF